MAKKNEENENAPEEKPVAKKPKPKKGVDLNQLDLFFTAYTPPAKDGEGNDAHHKGKGIDSLVPEAKPTAPPKDELIDEQLTEETLAPEMQPTDTETDDEVYEVRERKPKKNKGEKGK